MTKEQFFALTMPNDPDKAALAVEILERAWEVVELELLQIRLLEEQLWEKRTPEEIRISVMQTVAAIIGRRLKKKSMPSVRVFWANHRQMEKRVERKTFGAEDSTGHYYPFEWGPQPAPRYHAVASIVVVADQVKDREDLRGAILDPEYVQELGCDPARLIMLSPNDLKRVKAGELEVPEAFGVHWELVYPQGV